MADFAVIGIVTKIIGICFSPEISAIILNLPPSADQLLLLCVLQLALLPAYYSRILRVK